MKSFVNEEFVSLKAHTTPEGRSPDKHPPGGQTGCYV